MSASTETEPDAPTGASRFLPILDWGRRYDRSWLRGDLVAGLAVAALVVPKSLGYAGIAGVPIQHGLYAAAAGTILYALFGTARQISTGPSSALAAVAGSAVVLAGVSGDDAVALVAAITVVTGLAFLVLAIFKMGWISLFLSKAVITGFLFGAAIEVVIGELPKMTGTSYRVPAYPVSAGAEVPKEDFEIIERMPVKSLVTFPANGASSGMSTDLRGHAWSGDRTIERVDISIDFGATWKQAELDAPVNDGAWQNWRSNVSFPQAGYYEVWARATDSAGVSQPHAIDWNPKGYLNNTMHRVGLRVG